ncbi:pentapeptide repeat-containing protein [Aliarcobacter butzleri]|uniref:pentapeptide repeat-containing protein n=1 Tax=Aliarcobacter butzleri TaxID=28197 RepID=UPI003AFA329D
MKNLADFYNSTFAESINFEKTTFRDISVFTNVTFKNDVNFKYTTFEKIGQFKETIFEKTLNLEDSIIKEKINFLKIKTKNNKELNSCNMVNRETARIIKDSFEKQNNIIEANKYYALEMKKEKKN